MLLLPYSFVKVGLAPVQHIDGKPHDGLMSYGLVTKSTRTNLPYVLALVPYVGDELTMDDVLHQFISLFPNSQPLHFVLDARFSSFTLFKKIICSYPNCKLTMSMKGSVEKWIWDILDQTTQVNMWKALYNTSQGYLVSLLKRRPAARNYQILTNAFKLEQHPSLETSPWTIAQAKILASLELPCLQNLVAQAGKIPMGTSQECVSQLTTVDVDANESPSHASQLFDVSNDDSSISTHDDDEDQQPSDMTGKAIRSMQVTELRTLLKRNKLSARGNKKELVQRALDNLSPSEALRRENVQLFRQLQTSDHFDEAPHHTIYRAHFNGEDLANRLWYRVDRMAPQQVAVWTSRFLWGLIRIALGNAFALYCESQDIDYIQFREMWANWQLRQE